MPDEKERTNHLEIAIPNGASLILTHELLGEVKGLNEFEGKHPPVAPVFYAFRIMLATGILMFMISWLVSITILRGKELNKPLLNGLMLMTFSGWFSSELVSKTND